MSALVAAFLCLSLVPTNKALSTELQQRAARDQAARAQLIKTPLNTPQYRVYLKQMQSVDKDNTARMKKIIGEYGWPGNSLVGQKGADAAFLLVQHADADKKFQQRCFPLVLRALDEGEIRKPDAALFIDRVLVGEGKPQEYGSQWKWGNGQKGMAPYPIADPDNVDKRRKLMSLMPLKDYQKVLEQVYKVQLAPAQKKSAKKGKS